MIHRQDLLQAFDQSCGHHATERYGAPAVAGHVARQLGLEHEFIDVPNPA